MTSISTDGSDAQKVVVYNCAMSKHLLIGGGSENWNLADATDLDVLRRTIEEAMRLGEVLQLPVFLPDRPDAPITLLLNAGAAASVALVEL